MSAESVGDSLGLFASASGRGSGDCGIYIAGVMGSFWAGAGGWLRLRSGNVQGRVRGTVAPLFPFWESSVLVRSGMRSSDWRPACLFLPAAHGGGDKRLEKRRRVDPDQKSVTGAGHYLPDRSAHPDSFPRAAPLPPAGALWEGERCHLPTCTHCFCLSRSSPVALARITSAK